MLYKRIMVGIRQRFNLYLEEADIDNILLKGKHRIQNWLFEGRLKLQQNIWEIY